MWGDARFRTWHTISEPVSQVARRSLNSCVLQCPVASGDNELYKKVLRALSHPGGPEPTGGMFCPVQMKLFAPFNDDFEALIRIYTFEEGGRKSAPFNGIRWDFAYADDVPLKELYMIPPDFYDQNGDSLPRDQPLPLNLELPARMFVCVDRMREQLHRSRIHEGVRFYCHEGARRVAEGRVTRITGLSTERS